MDKEVIDVDAFEPEITVGRQGKRILRALLIPSGRPKPKPKEIVDLTGEDDEDVHVTGPSTSRTMSSNSASTARVPKTSVSRPQEGSSKSAPTSRATASQKTRHAPPSTSKGKAPVKLPSMATVSQPYRKVGPPRGVKPDSPMSSRSSLARPRSSRPANAPSSLPRDPEREAEEEWETYHDGLHINRQPNWNNRVSVSNDEILGEHNLYEDLEAAQQDAQDSVYSHVKARARHAIRSIHKPFGGPIQPTATPSGMLGKTFRDVFSQAEYTSVQKNVLDHNSIHKVTPRARRRCTRNITHYAYAKETKYLGMLPGAVNSISQSGDLTAITSCVPGGSIFSDPADVPYNCEGTLVVMYKDRSMQHNVHSRDYGSGTEPSTHYFSVSEALFDPNWPEYLWSCGDDGRLFQSNCAGIKEGREPGQLQTFNYPASCVPRGMTFQPDGSSLAVSLNSTEVYIHSPMDVMTCWVLDAAPEVNRAGLSIQDMTWGVGATNKTIVVTSALDDWEASSTPPDFFGGSHRMFDLQTQQMIMQLSNRETGECVAIDPRGNTLALAVAPATHVTRLKNIPDPKTRRLVEVEVYSWTWKFALELYDVRAHRTRPAQRTHMPSPDEAASAVVKPSISCVAWSPDGIYVAAARTDNCTQVFDARMLARGALYEFWHGSPMEGSKSDEMFGVCRTEWVQDGRCGLGLVTGGADGCVRLWDVHRSRGESTVLAQSTHYSSWFCMGDTSKGEHAVVLGDGGGNIIVRG